jgi:hypothetical protein
MRICLVLFLAALSFSPGFQATGVAGPIDYSYALVADTTDSFASLFQAPALNDAGTVAFAGTEHGQLPGIYTGLGGTITTVARGYTYQDTMVSVVATVSSVPSINASGSVTWIAQSQVTRNSHPPQTTVDTLVQTSGSGSIASVQQGPFLSLGKVPSINDTGGVAFQGQLKTGISGIFLGTSYNTYTTIADTTQRFSAIGDAPSVNSRGVVAFNASLQGGGSGIFTGAGNATITTIADTSGPLANLGVASLNNSGAVTFRADLKAGGQGIFTSDGLSLARIADTSGLFSSFADGPAINDRGIAAFVADLKAGGKGLFTGTDQALDEVIATGDALFGSTVSDLGFFRQGFNDLGQLAFWAQLTDGREVIALGTPTPEPATVVMLGIGMLLLIGYASKPGPARFRLGLHDEQEEPRVIGRVAPFAVGRAAFSNDPAFFKRRFLPGHCPTGRVMQRRIATMHDLSLTSSDVATCRRCCGRRCLISWWKRSNPNPWFCEPLHGRRNSLRFLVLPSAAKGARTAP